MSEFPAEWLELREPADRRARSDRVTRAFCDALRPGGAPLIVDLGAGTGANVRYLAPRLARPAHWRLVDHDQVLLRRAVGAATSAPVESVAVDLRSSLPAVLTGAAAVTASALLDLVSDAWLTALADGCARLRVPVLFALSYDGRIACAPADEDDEAVRGLVNLHQRTDKGFGPALGPEAPPRACAIFEARGYGCVRERSDWRLGSEDARLQQELIAGWAAAASAARPECGTMASAWRGRRLAHVRAGRSQILVGHEDVAAWPVR